MSDIYEETQFIRDALPLPDLYEQLAEESAELAQAANKLARVLRGINPANVSRSEAMSHVVEEYTDVIVVAQDILSHYPDKCLAEYKIKRWAKRLEDRNDEIRDHS